MEWLLGIDDTDVLGHKPGTGRLARELGAHLVEAADIRLVGVVRQQLLVDPRIPYTSHNSPACVVLEAADSAAVASRIFAVAMAYVLAHCASGSDPGVCLAPRVGLPAAVTAFGIHASHVVLAKDDAERIATEYDLRLAPLAGTGDGIIGALAAVGLTAGGDAGRFLDYGGGLRELGDQVAAAELYDRGIRCVSLSRNGEVVPPDALLETGGWLRPRLLGGRPVLLVEPADGGWRCFDRRQREPENGDEG